MIDAGARERTAKRGERFLQGAPRPVGIDRVGIGRFQNGRQALGAEVQRSAELRMHASGEPSGILIFQQQIKFIY